VTEIGADDLNFPSAGAGNSGDADVPSPRRQALRVLGESLNLLRILALSFMPSIAVVPVTCERRRPGLSVVVAPVTKPERR
jgi:hypothetical protein